jgi:hypothetical protein
LVCALAEIAFPSIARRTKSRPKRATLEPRRE